MKRVSLSLKFLPTSRMASFFNPSPLHTHTNFVSRRVVSVPEIAATNFMALCFLLASSMNVFISYSFHKFHREKTSSIHLFKVGDFTSLRLIISVSTAAIRMTSCKYYG